jgi:V8-like Glu-specific endopeptidase
MEKLMRQRMIVVGVIALMLLAAPVAAITNGQLDGNKHPNVGGLVSDEQYSDGTWLYCSGTLISPTVFLTAAHCGDDGSTVTVTFDTAYEAGDKTYSGTFYADPLYGHDQSDSHDIAVVVFDKPIRGITPASLPTADSLSTLKGTQKFTSVGYGAASSTTTSGWLRPAH